MKKYVIGGIFIVGILVLALNPNIVADQVVKWAKQNVANPDTPEIVYNTGRICGYLQDDDTAIGMFNYLYETYPDNAALCAPAMYYAGKIKADNSYVKVFRMQAVPFLQIVIDQYPDSEWAPKAKQLMYEVTGEKP
ncbi:MAG TPA: hypothetical protein VK791_04490 [bacterium]|jgi:TolA-binding protein|nr:hypothetical protein [bacterium]